MFDFNENFLSRTTQKIGTKLRSKTTYKICACHHPDPVQFAIVLSRQQLTI